jgi:hypothetical protein
VWARLVLELVNALHALGLFCGEDEAAERGLELLSTRSVGHAAEAWAIPVDLASLRVERPLLIQWAEVRVLNLGDDSLCFGGRGSSDLWGLGRFLWDRWRCNDWCRTALLFN